jgi:uncharacterized membrane protein YraQ (UPF0718 family)
MYARDYVLDILKRVWPYVLVGIGMAMGTVLAFMMAVTALSLPEMIILRNVLKPQLIGVFIGIVATSIIIVGYLFNTLLVV